MRDPDLLEGFTHVYLGVGSNLSVQVRKDTDLLEGFAHVYLGVGSNLSVQVRKRVQARFFLKELSTQLPLLPNLGR